MATIGPVTRDVPSAIPPLVDGDRLTRDEFERRYDAMPELKKAELIEGVVHMPSPVSWSGHAFPHTNLMYWLTTYRVKTPGLQTGDNGTIRLDLDNEPQPDVAMIVLPALGGQARFTPDDYIEGAPELVAEVAASSASIDLNKKLRVYQRNKVLEYVVWRVLDQAVDWFTLVQGRYDRLTPSNDGYLRSRVFPGLWLDADALIRDDMLTLLRVLQEGIASPEHADFVADLQSRSAGA